MSSVQESQVGLEAWETVRSGQQWQHWGMLPGSSRFSLPAETLLVPICRSSSPSTNSFVYSLPREIFQWMLRLCKLRMLLLKPTRVPNQTVPSGTWTRFPQELGQGLIPSRRLVGFWPLKLSLSYWGFRGTSRSLGTWVLGVWACMLCIGPLKGWPS